MIISRLLEAAKERALSTKCFRMRRKRSSTVEPVWVTLMNFTAMKRINTRGLSEPYQQFCKPKIRLQLEASFLSLLTPIQNLSV